MFVGRSERISIKNPFGNNFSLTCNSLYLVCLFYYRFLPLCTHSQILRRRNATHFEATLTVGLPPLFSETYVSAVTVDLDHLVVETKSIQSQSFDGLSSRWKLLPVQLQPPLFKHNNHNFQCHVDFQVEMTVSDPIIQSTLDRVLEQIAGKQVEAFAARCREIPLDPSSFS